MVKTRDNVDELTYDENGFKRRAACVVFRDESEKEVMLITSKHYNSDKQWWLMPGGSIEAVEEPERAAEREVYEESGVKGQIIRSLGQVVNEKKMTRTWVYVMIVKDELENWDDKMIGRKRQWFSVSEAKELLVVYKPVQVKYIDLAQRHRGHRCDSMTAMCPGDCNLITPLTNTGCTSRSHSIVSRTESESSVFEAT